jgi:SNF2 family DNA or RNA helicase
VTSAKITDSPSAKIASAKITDSASAKIASAKNQPSGKYIGYKSKTTPYIQQAEAFNKTKDFIYAAYFMEQGTGKTKVIIDRAAYLWEKAKIDGLLVICPNSLTETWAEEIKTHAPERVKPIVAIWNPDLPKYHVKELEAVLYNDGLQLPILIMNVEGIRTPKASKLASWWLRHKRIFAVADESSRIKTPSAKQSIAAVSLARDATARAILTGTPVSNSPADYFMQLRFLLPNPLGFSNFYSFRARYCELEVKRTKVKPYFDKKKKKLIKLRSISSIIGPQNAEELKKKLLPFSVFVKKADCMDLPDKIYHKRHCDLTKDGIRIYKDAAKQILLEIDGSRELTIEVQLARLLRLQQITGGFLPDDDSNSVAEPIPGENPKINLLLETISEFPGATLIWSRFKAEHDAIRKALEAITHSNRIGEITGRIPHEQRDEARIKFQAAVYDYLICTQSCAGYGYTLTAAENEIYYSNTFSLEHREQSEDRAHRIGQDKHVNIIDLIMRSPPQFKGVGVDAKIHAALMDKREVAALMTDVSGLEDVLK